MGSFMKRLLALGALGMVSGCGEERPAEPPYFPEYDAKGAAERAAEGARGEQETARSAPRPVILTSADRGRACRAIIASLNGRDPAIIRVISTDGDIYRVRYTRDDGTVWTNECRVDDGTAKWRMIENGQPGRWRDEDTILFSVEGKSIRVKTFMNGDPITNDTYTVE